MRPLRFAVLLLPVFFVIATAQITLNPLPTRVIGQLSTTLTSTSPNLVEGREFQFPEAVGSGLYRLGQKLECARSSWRDLAGESPARVRP